MNREQSTFVHTLLFRCQDCTKPLAISVTRIERNFESVDATAFDLRCICGWSRSALGVQAARHWLTALDENTGKIGPRAATASKSSSLGQEIDQEFSSLKYS